MENPFEQKIYAVLHSDNKQHMLMRQMPTAATLEDGTLVAEYVINKVMVVKKTVVLEDSDVY